MKSSAARMQEFVRYHIHGDGECNNVVLRAWADRHCLDFQQRYELAYFFSITYSVVSASLVFEEQRNVFKGINAWVRDKKPLLVFQSDRKYVRMRDSFEKTLRHFEQIRSAEEFMKRVSDGGRIALGRAIPYVEKWPMFGRFSAFLFLETFVALTDCDIENTTIDWKNGNTATSGLLNLFGMDEQAAEFDKTGRLYPKLTYERMDGMLQKTIEEIGKAGGSTNVTEIETSLCAYRKFYKGSRYNGYYLDRMLEEIYKMQADFPKLTQEMIDIRAEHFDRRYLGEAGGWRGVRPKMKKLYKETGIVS